MPTNVCTILAIVPTDRNCFGSTSECAEVAIARTILCAGAAGRLFGGSGCIEYLSKLCDLLWA